MFWRIWFSTWVAGLGAVVTLCACSSGGLERFNGTWQPRPGSDAGLAFLSLAAADGGLDVVVAATGPEESSTLFGHHVLSGTIESRTGRFTSVDPLTVDWDPLETISYELSDDGLIRAAYYAPSPGAHQRFAGPLETDEDGDDTLLVLPSGALSEYGVPSGRSLIRFTRGFTFVGWVSWESALGDWRSREWPAPLTRLPDAGLPVMDWPATRLVVSADGGFAFFRLDQGTARSMQGTVSDVDGRWLFHPSGVPPPLALDDGTLAQPEPALVPETEQVAYRTLSGLVVTGLGAPAMLPEGFTDGGFTPP